MPRAGRLLLLAAALLSTPAGARAQDTRARFPVTAIQDTTFAFRPGPARWIRPGAEGSVVDPRRHDALVARFRVLAARPDTVTALIVGQTMPLSTEHVALLVLPRAHPRRNFWLGTLLGLAVGAFTGVLVAR